MRIAHNCSRCGIDLSGLRAVPDPHYHLAVIVCPRCTAACVRTKQEAFVIWRQASRLFYAWSRLAFQIGLAAMFANATLLGAREITAGLFHTGSVMTLGGWFSLGFLALTALGAGLWLGSSFPHWKRGPLLLAWALLVILLIPIGAAADAYDSLSVSYRSSTATAVGEFWERFGHETDNAALQTLVAAGLVTIQALLSPLGFTVRRVNRVLLRLKTRFRRRVLRGTGGRS